MLERSVTITNRRGLHARAAAKFVTIAERYDAVVDVLFDGQTVPAASIMGLMMLGAAAGAVITLRADGREAEAAVESLAALVEAGFNETD